MLRRLREVTGGYGRLRTGGYGRLREITGGCGRLREVREVTVTGGSWLSVSVCLSVSVTGCYWRLREVT